MTYSSLEYDPLEDKYFCLLGNESGKFNHIILLIVKDRKEALAKQPLKPNLRKEQTKAPTGRR